MEYILQTTTTTKRSAQLESKGMGNHARGSLMFLLGGDAERLSHSVTNREFRKYTHHAQTYQEGSIVHSPLDLFHPRPKSRDQNGQHIVSLQLLLIYTQQHRRKGFFFFFVYKGTRRESGQPVSKFGIKLATADVNTHCRNVFFFLLQKSSNLHHRIL